ncbi:MAG: hypothetical protein C0591_01110 [Marinilabiliales bacterium]|nr:MAG: hypothetical protein C0591_01110 [Marinilabiliales bacterium]
MMAIKMVSPFKSFKPGQIITPEDDLATWLVSRKYAVVVKAAAPGAEKKTKAPAKRGRKKADQ